MTNIYANFGTYQKMNSIMQLVTVNRPIYICMPSYSEARQISSVGIHRMVLPVLSVKPH